MPSAKRKDIKGRNLRDNEFQKKDGRYEYRFTDKSGKTKSVYSWRLVASDKTPSGKRECKPLREMEIAIQRDIDASLIVDRTATVNDYWEKMIQKKQGLKDYTRFAYQSIYNTVVKPMLGEKKIVDVKRSDVEDFYLHQVNERGIKPINLGSYHTVLAAIFEEAVRDEIIRSNPVSGVVNDLKRRKIWNTAGWIAKEKYVFSDDAQARFISFIKKDPFAKYWCPMFLCFLGTGCRFGEMAALCWEDINWENKTISINKTMRYYRRGDEHSAFHISSTKTKSGTRVIPMLSAVETILKNEYEKQHENGFCNLVIDGHTHFIWTGRTGRPLTSQQFDHKLLNATARYNQYELKLAQEENRKPCLIERFSAHNLRHTFCTRFCQNEKDIKVVQEIMGHASITTTMNIYNKCTLERKQHSFSKLEDKFGI